MSNANWWARKLGQPQPAQQSSGYTPNVYTGHPPAQPVQPSLAPFQAPQTPPAVITGDNIAAAAAMWQGGAGTRTETSHCPNCGSPNYFSRSNQGFQNPNHTGAGPSLTTDRGSFSVAARCFDCNHSSAATHPSLQ